MINLAESFSEFESTIALFQIDAKNLALLLNVLNSTPVIKILSFEEIMNESPFEIGRFSPLPNPFSLFAIICTKLLYKSFKK